MTKQRRIIHEIIMNSHGHLTAEEIFLQAKEKLPSIAVGTVYRNLGLMTQQGEIGKISVPNSSHRYDKSPAPHGHVICECCGKIKDSNFTDIKQLLESQLGESITAYRLSVYYICSDCRYKRSHFKHQGGNETL